MSQPGAPSMKSAKSRFGLHFNHDGQVGSYDADVQDESKPVRAGYSALLDWVAKQAQPVSGKTVLDLGCGTGNLSLRLGRGFRKLICVDISKRMLEAAKRKLPRRNVEFIRSDVLDCSRKIGHPVDAVVSTYALHHLTPREKAAFFKKLASMLQPGARVVFGDLMFKDELSRRTFIRQCASGRERELVGGIKEEFYWLIDRSRRALTAAGFKIASVKRFSALSWGVAATKVGLPISVKGVVFNGNGEVLLLKNHRDEFELPGGRLEPGESPSECLSREILEECGIQAVARKALTPRTFEVIPGKHVLLVPFLCTAGRRSQLKLSNEHTEGGFYDAAGLSPKALPRKYARIIAEARMVSRMA